MRRRWSTSGSPGRLPSTAGRCGRSSMSPLRRTVERLLEVGNRCRVLKTAGTCRDILKRRETLWTFVQITGVEPTKNAAEVRSVDQKPSGQLGGLVPR